MQGLQQLPPRFLLPASSVRAAGRARWLHGSKPASPASSSSSSAKTFKALPLRDELFPEEAETNTREPKKVDRRVPRLLLPRNPEIINTKTSSPAASHYARRRPQLVRRVNTAGFIERYAKAGMSPSIEPLRRRGETTGHHPHPEHEPTILVLRNASTSLVASDFRRIVPGGRHIREWKSKGDILKVIPGRDARTLAPLGSYYILFSSPSSAHAYREHAIRLHRLARTHTQQSLHSPLPPPPGYIIDGEDLHALLQSYNLMPPSQKLQLKVLPTPYTPAVQQLIRHGGYSRVKLRNGTTDNTVLLHVDGPWLSTGAIQKMIEVDGRQRRNMSWRKVGGEGAISLLDAPVASQESGEDVDEIDRDTSQSKVRQSPPRWLIEFEDEDEARSFVRAWHKRPVPTASVDSNPGESIPIVNAELVW